MEQKINVAELLKDCPSGMELDSTIMENVYFDEVLNNSIKCYYIKNSTKIRSTVYFNKFGEYFGIENGKCVIFPKGKTTWEGFHRPFKDGDVVSAIISGKLWYGIYKKEFDRVLYCYVSYSTVTESMYQQSNVCSINSISEMHFATEEEKQKLFQAIKDNGYKWNAETKTLENLPKFKDGDVIANNTRIVIFHKLDKIPNGIRNDVVYYHCWYHKENNNSKFKIDFGIGYASDFRFATKEEKQILFDVIKANGYKWNPETKTLKKLVKPRFKVGNRVKSIYNNNQYDIVGLTDTHYTLVEVENKFKYTEPIIEDKNLELVPNKFDITTLKPFDKVLVRDTNTQKWTADLFSLFDKSLIYPYSCVGHYTNQCIPYEGNEHLLNTTDDCDEFYKNW